MTVDHPAERSSGGEVMEHPITKYRSPAEAYEAVFVPTMFGPLTRFTLEHADIREGARVLDLACGTGIVARNVAPLAGAAGKIVAVDLRPGMLATASSQPTPDGAPIEWRQGDATALDLPDAAFDLVICQQGLQFFADRPAALAEMRRVLVDGGQVVLAVWRGLEHLTFFKELMEAEARHLEKLGVTYEELTTPFRMDSADELRDLLKGAGFRDAAVSEVSLDVRFPSAATFIEDVEVAYASVMPQFIENPGAFRDYVVAVERDLRPIVERYRDGNGVRFWLKSHIATARR
jgi:ubiquinone/menaquinone biosynthesis C-methylase UbiE